MSRQFQSILYETQGKIAFITLNRPPLNLIDRDMDFKTVPQTAADAVALCFDSLDSREARKSFTEKRAPVWKGK